MRVSKPGHVGLVDLRAQGPERSLLALREGRVGIGLDGVDFFDDAARMRLDDLGAVGEVALEAVVMRRVVARGEDDAGIGTGMADGE